MPKVEKQTMRSTLYGESKTGKTILVKPEADGAPSAWDLVGSIRLLLYGESGTGKTTLWATFPGPILALICSGGRNPGELRSIDTPENRRKINARVVSSVETFGRLIEDAAQFETVVLDHSSGLQDLILKETLGIEEIPATKRWGLATGDDWQEVNRKTIEILRRLLNLDKHIVIVCQERIFKGRDDVGSSDVIRPVVGAGLTPAVAGWLNPACDYIVQAFKRPRMVETTVKIGDKKVKQQIRGKGVEYCIRTEAHETFMTKFRIPRRELPDVIVDPTFEKINHLIQGS